VGLSGNRSLAAPCDADHPLLDLAASIVVKAVHDWRRYGKLEDCGRIGSPLYIRVIHGAGFSSPREELISFFRSEWCRDLLAPFSIDYKTMIEELQRKWGFPNG